VWCSAAIIYANNRFEAECGAGAVESESQEGMYNEDM
jgi:hypothetical protein